MKMEAGAESASTEPSPDTAAEEHSHNMYNFEDAYFADPDADYAFDEEGEGAGAHVA